MKFKLFIIAFLFLIVNLATFAQSEAKEGYIVNNQHQRMNCLIRNVGHEESMMNYEFKLKGSEDFEEIEISKIEEFGVDNEFKCIRALVYIDVSKANIPDKKDAILEWQKGHVYLRILFEGELASLYSFFYEGKTVYYYSWGDNPIEPLVYKMYYVGVTPLGYQDILYDNSYQVQLKDNLACGNSDTKKVTYTEKDLVKYFANYHQCKKSDFNQLKSTHVSQGKLLIKPSINFNSSQLTIKEFEDAAPRVPFTKESSVGFGVELEYVLPYNNYLWSVFAGANYMSYATDKLSLDDGVNSSMFDGYATDYKTVEAPIGIGININMNQNQRLYLKAAFAPHFILGGSYITFNNGANKDEFSVASRFLFGVGYSFRNVGLEFNYYTPQNLTQNKYKRASDLEQISVKLSYAFQLLGDR